MNLPGLDEKYLKNHLDPAKIESELLKWRYLENVESSDRPKLLPQFKACLMACWVNLASGASLGYGTPALPSLQTSGHHLSVNETETSWLAGAMMLGALIGALLSGPCISLGRRTTLWVLAVPLTSAWTITAFSRHLWTLVTAHAIFGICLGITGDATQIYVCEVVHASWRGALGCIPVLMFNMGILLSYIAGLWLKWDELALSGALLTLPALVLPFSLPESPIYLIAKDKLERAMRALRWLRGAQYDLTLEFQEYLQCARNTTGSINSQFHEIFHRDMIIPLIITSVIRALSRFCGIRAVLLYTVSILLDSKIDVDVGIITLATGGIQLVATGLACLIVDRISRRTLLIISQGVMTLALGVLGGYLYIFQDSPSTTYYKWIPIIAILVYILANALGLGPISGLIVAELSPQRHRSFISSITGCISWLSAFIVTKTYVDLTRTSLKLYGTLWLYAGVCIFGIIFVFIFLPETRGLKEYDIEILFKQNNCRNS